MLKDLSIIQGSGRGPGYLTDARSKKRVTYHEGAPIEAVLKNSGNGRIAVARQSIRNS